MTDGTFVKDFYHNTDSQPGFVGFTANFPGTIIPINLDENGGSIACEYFEFSCFVQPMNFHFQACTSRSWLQWIQIARLR